MVKVIIVNYTVLIVILKYTSYKNFTDQEINTLTLNKD
jgi:hypothetical protein